MPTSTVVDQVVARSSRWLARGSSRRSFLVKTAVVGSALAANPLQYILRPGKAYASVCGPGSDCGSGWTVFCCTVNGGANTCPPGSIPAGWWKSDNSSFCGGAPRYIIDCNATCRGCGCGSSGICAPGCYSCGCECASGTCDQRRHCCNAFRYGQCHQELACVGPVVCRVATCAPPWQFDPTCTTASATANETALHSAPCLVLDDSLDLEEDEMWAISDKVPAGTNQAPGVVAIGLPAGRKSATVRLFVDVGDPGGASLFGAQIFNSTAIGAWGGGQTWELWLPGKRAIDAVLHPDCHQLHIEHRGPAGPPVTVVVSGT